MGKVHACKARERESTHTGVGRHTCGKEKHKRKKALARRQKKGKVYEMGCTNARDSL